MNGSNTVKLVYSGGTASYAVTFRQDGSCLNGSLTDTNIPAGNPNTGPIHGLVNGDNITFSYTYTYPGSNQGTRTFTGTISHGAVSGTWTESGTEGLYGTWSLASNVHRACSPRVRRWQPWRECTVRS